MTYAESPSSTKKDKKKKKTSVKEIIVKKKKGLFGSKQKPKEGMKISVLMHLRDAESPSLKRKREKDSSREEEEFDENAPLMTFSPVHVAPAPPATPSSVADDAPPPPPPVPPPLPPAPQMSKCVRYARRKICSLLEPRFPSCTYYTPSHVIRIQQPAKRCTTKENENS